MYMKPNSMNEGWNPTGPMSSDEMGWPMRRPPLTRGCAMSCDACVTECSAQHTCNAWARVRRVLWPQWWIGVGDPSDGQHDRGGLVSDAGKL